MGIMSSEWRGRLQHWMRTLKDDFYRPLGEISWEAFRTMDHLSQEEAMNGPFEPVEPGFTWGKTWEYCWFRGKVVLPAEAQGKRIVMDLKPDGESTLFVNGQEFGTYRASWVTQKHHFVEDNVLTTDAVAGTEYEILMETYAGHYYPESPDGGCATGPVLPGAGPAPGGGAWRRGAAACAVPPDHAPCAAGRRVCGQRAEGPLCAGASSVYGLWRPVHELRAADPCRLPLHRVSLRPRGGSPHGSGRLVLCDRGRLAAGRRQGVRRAGEKPLSQGAAAAVNGQKKRIFPRRMLKTGRIRLERSARLCYNNRVRFCVLPQAGDHSPSARRRRYR